MKQRWGTTTALAASMVAFAALSSTPAAAQHRAVIVDGNAAAVTPTAEQATAGALRRDLGLTGTDLKKRWAAEAHSRDVDRTVRTRLGKRYAGT